MSNINEPTNFAKNSNSTNYSGGFGRGGYDQSEKYNPWKNQSLQTQQSSQYLYIQPQSQQLQEGIQGKMQLKWKSFAAINLILVWLIYFIVTVISQTTENKYRCILFQFGAQYQPSITFNYQFHRYIFPTYLHGSFQHILSNSIGLFFYGFTLEKYYGTKKLVIFYFLCCFGGNLLSGFNSPQSLSIGASSSLFGLFALIILYLIENQDINQKQKLIYVTYIIAMIFFNIFGFNDRIQQEDQKFNQNEKNVDNAAHLGITLFLFLIHKQTKNQNQGGLVTGIFLSVIYCEVKYLKQQSLFSFY